jgi:hypothetical protein
MKTYDITKTYEIETPDLEKGYLVIDTRVIRHHSAKPIIQEQGHYEVVKTYANGGQDVRWVVDVEGSKGEEAYDETETINVYIPYTDYELAKKRIDELKEMLKNTDYQAIKFAEGVMYESEYAPIRTQRQPWREEINRLQTVYGVV